MRARQLAVAVRPQHQHPHRLVRRGHVTQQLQARLVGPLQVIQHQHDRLVLRHHHQESDDRREQQEPLRVGVGGLRRRQPRQPARQRRNQSGQLRAVFVHVRDELFFGGVGDVVPERLGEQLIRRREVFLAMPEQHTRPAIERRPRRVGDERGLAQTGLTRDEEHLASLARGDALERVRHRSPSRSRARRHPTRDARPDGPATAPRSSQLRRAVPSAPRPCPTGSGKPFNVSWPERTALVTAAPARHRAHHVRGEDLTTLTRRAEPGRLDHRVAEVVVVLARDFTDAQPDPQTDRLLAGAVVSFDALLHPNRARQRGRRRGEHDHEPVTQVLHLGAARLGDRLPQDREVPAAQLVGRVRRQARRQRGRTHHVGEQDRHVLGRHRAGIPVCTALR